MEESLFDFLAVREGEVEPFMHKGEWAVHESLPHLLEATGPADVRIATFSVSEDSLRPLLFLRESGKVRSLRLLLDYTVKRHKLDLLLFALQVTPDIRIDSCHAKILLAEGSGLRIGMVGSANFNRNHRWEAGVWFSGGELYDYYSKKFDEAYGDGLPYPIE